MTNDTIYLSGKTYEYKDRIRKAGFSWDSGTRCWVGTREQLKSCITVTRSMPGVVVIDRAEAVARDMDSNPDSIF